MRVPVQQFLRRPAVLAPDAPKLGPPPNFLYRDHLAPLIEQADIIKIDLQMLDEAQLRQQVEVLKPFGVQLLAEKIESQHEFKLCQSLGLEHFQGYYFTRPRVIAGRRLPSNQLTAFLGRTRGRDQPPPGFQLH